MVQMQAEIERLKAERDAAIKEIGKWSREAGASQAREAKLLEALVKCSVQLGNLGYSANHADQALILPTDDTALQEAIKQGQREALLEAAEAIIKDASRIGSDWVSAHHADTLRKKADEL
jgi:hypothetical protein